MASTTKVLSELRFDEQLLHLTLNAPKANVLDSEMMGGIEEELEAHGRRPGLKAIAFEGAGKHFSFGASVPEHTADRVAGMLKTFHRIFLHLSDLNVPTMAIIRGQCLGGGLELASYCTWLFASPDAKLGQPEIQLAVFPPAASVLLPWRVGAAHAMDLCISGRSISAEEAQRIGLVSAVAEDPRAVADEFFETNLAPKSASSLRFAEAAARLDLKRILGEKLPAIEKLYVDELMATHDANEGIASFLEKRKPEFRDE